MSCKHYLYGYHHGSSFSLRSWVIFPVYLAIDPHQYVRNFFSTSSSLFFVSTVLLLWIWEHCFRNHFKKLFTTIHECHGFQLVNARALRGRPEFLLLCCLGFTAGDDGELYKALLVALNHQRHHQRSLYCLPSFKSRQEKFRIEM